MKKKSILALVLALMLTLCTLTACSQSTTPSESAAPGESQAADGETQEAQEPTAGASGKTRPTTNGKADNSLTVAISDPITTLDPELFKKQSEDNIIINVYDPLFYLDNDGNIVNALAEEYTVNDDGSVDVTLRAAKFHSGDDLKAEDVAYTLSHCTHSPLCSTLVGTMEVEVVDDSHIKLVFPKADQGYNFEALMPYIQGMNIINKSYCETVISDPNGDLGFNVDGTGAYKFVSKNENGDVVLEPVAIMTAEQEVRTDNAPEKRVELHRKSPSSPAIWTWRTTARPTLRTSRPTTTSWPRISSSTTFALSRSIASRVSPLPTCACVRLLPTA